MATRKEVEKAIKTIKTNGKNTAVKVQGVLTTLLDYTENTTNDSGLKSFKKNNLGKLVISDLKTANLLYSFRGFEKRTVNFSFRLKVLKVNKSAFSFTLEAALVPILKEIIKSGGISFIVPLERKQRVLTGRRAITTITAVPLSLSLKSNKLTMSFLNVKMAIKDVITTSIQLHAL